MARRHAWALVPVLLVVTGCDTSRTRLSGTMVFALVLCDFGLGMLRVAGASQLLVPSLV